MNRVMREEIIGNKYSDEKWLNTEAYIIQHNQTIELCQDIISKFEKSMLFLRIELLKLAYIKAGLNDLEVTK